MKRKHQRLARIGLALLVVIVVLVGAGIWFVERPWPQIDGTLVVSVLSASVKVVRDQWGIPNIYAEN